MKGFYMEYKLKKAKDILSKYGQEHLLQFYDELTIEQQDYLLNQILSIDFDEILYLYEKGKINAYDSTERIEPLPYIDKENLSLRESKYFSQIGNKAISEGKIGVITLAGGQGSRLGFRGPKGTFGSADGHRGTRTTLTRKSIHI